MATTSDILIGAGDIKFGDDDTTQQIARLFINPNAASATPNTLEIEGSGTGVLADIIGLVATPSGPTAAASKAYVDSTVAGTGDVSGPATSVTNTIPTFADATGKLLADASAVTIATPGELVANVSLTATTGNIVTTSPTGEVQSRIINVGNATGNTKITTGATAADIIFQLPSNEGTSGQFLKTTGSGVLSWDVPTGLQFTDNVKAAEAPGGSNITLAPAPATIDGYTLVNGDLVIIMAQTNAVENGIYEFNGTDLVRPTTGLYSTGSNVADAVTFVTDGLGKNTSYVQTASQATVDTDPLSYSIFAAQPEAQGPQFAIQYADPAGVFQGSADFTWNGTLLDVTGQIQASTGITATTGSITAAGGSIQANSDITSIGGSIIANTNLSCGGDLILGAGSNPTTLKNNPSLGAVQDIILPQNSAGANGDVLSISNIVTGATEWVTPTTGTGDVSGPATSVTNTIPTFADATGKLLADASAVTIATPGELVANVSLTATTGDITATAGNLVATAGNVTAGATVSAGTDVIVGSATFPTTIKNPTLAASQNIVLPINSSGANGDVLSITDIATGATAWTTPSASTPPGGGLNSIQFNNPVGTFDGSADFTWDDTAKNLGVTGTIGASGRITALEVKTTSDATLKTNIAPLQDPLQQIKKIEGYSYNWKHDEQGPEMFGVLAQQLEEAGLSNIVSESYNGKKCVDYNQLIPLLLEGMKQMAKEIEELKK